MYNPYVMAVLTGIEYKPSKEEQENLDDIFMSILKMYNIKLTKKEIKDLGINNA